MTVNGLVSGVVEKVSGDDFLVRLSSGKCVIVNKLSCKDYDKEES